MDLKYAKQAPALLKRHYSRCVDIFYLFYGLFIYGTMSFNTLLKWTLMKYPLILGTCEYSSTVSEVVWIGYFGQTMQICREMYIAAFC